MCSSCAALLSTTRCDLGRDCTRGMNLLKMRFITVMSEVTVGTVPTYVGLAASDTSASRGMYGIDDTPFARPLIYLTPWHAHPAIYVQLRSVVVMMMMMEASTRPGNTLIGTWAVGFWSYKITHTRYVTMYCTHRPIIIL